LLKANRALLLYFGGRYDEALGELHAILDAEPNSAVAHWGAGLCYEQKGAAASAIAELQKAVSLSVSLNFKVSLAHAFGVFGKGAEARRILKMLQERARGSYVPSYWFAIVYAGSGQDELALDWLERAYQERSTVLAYLRLDPRLAPLHKDPRFGKLLERLGLPEAGAPIARTAEPASR
jgi:tetratricopeptide (TPR) repeat protein